MSDKMCGSVAATLAFTEDKVYGLCPSSTIEDDIRKLVAQYHPIIAIYQTACYISKKVDKEKMPDNLRKLLQE